jgi:hypothetical protein
MFDFVVAVLSTPRPAIVCTALGAAFAYLAWTYLPVTTDRTAISTVFVVGGFVVGMIWSAASETRKKK